MTTHSNRTNPFIVAMALGAGLFLLLQLVANRVLSRQADSSLAQPSSLLTIPQQQNNVQVSKPRNAVEMPIDLFNDEFFASPFLIDSGLVALKQDMDRQMQDVMQEASAPMLRRDDKTSLWNNDAFDIQQDDEKVTVTVTVPKSISKDNISIEVIDGSILHISGGRTDKNKDGKIVSQVQFDKQFALGRNMKQDEIEANLKNGILTVTTPKVGKTLKKKNVRKIPIKVEL